MPTLAGGQAVIRGLQPSFQVPEIRVDPANGLDLGLVCGGIREPAKHLLKVVLTVQDFDRLPEKHAPESGLTGVGFGLALSKRPQRQRQTETPVSTLSDDLRTLSYEAALYFYPLVTMDITRLQSINTPAGTKAGFGPPNEFHHLRTFPTADFRAVVRP